MEFLLAHKKIVSTITIIWFISSNAWSEVVSEIPAPNELNTIESITLEYAIKKTLENDPQIQSNIENIKQAEADLISAGLLPNPTLSSSVSLMPLNQPFTVNRQGGPPQTDIAVSFPLDWFLFGKRTTQIISAQKNVDVITAGYADFIRQRIATVVATFYDVLEAAAILELAKEDLLNLSDVETITSNRVKLGGVGTVELDKVQLLILNSHREVRVRELALQTAYSRLRTFLGSNDIKLIQVTGDLTIKSPLLQPISIERAIALAQENRPDLLALQRQVDQMESVVAAEKAKAYPQVTSHLGYTRQFQEKAIGFPDANAWGGGLDISIPLFDRNQGNIAKSQSAKAQSELDLKAKQVALSDEINQAVLTYQNAFQILTNDDPGQLEAARNVRNKIRSAYELGGKTLMEVLDAQRMYRETYRLHITARSSYWHALYALNAAVGTPVLQ